MKKMLTEAPQNTLARLMKRLYETELNTSKGGNLSMQVPEGRWCTPSGLDKADMHPEDMMFFRQDGAVVGKHDVSIETYIHMNIMDRCAGRRAVIHVHALPLIAYSVMHSAPNPRLYPNYLMEQKLPVTPFRIPGSQALADELVNAFNETGATAAILANHGAFFADENIYRALESLESMVALCRTEQASACLGQTAVMPENAGEILAGYRQEKLEETDCKTPSVQELHIMEEVAKLHARAYRKLLFRANSGTIAARINETDFIMPMDDCDRLALRVPEDFVIIRSGSIPHGSGQPRDAAFLAKLFAAHAGVQAVSIAQPPNAMAFAVTQAKLESRVLPESFSKLRFLRRLPFGSLDSRSFCAADWDPARGPVQVLDNECIVCTGKNIFDAFECCELVEEYGRIQVCAAQMGREMIALSDEELKVVLLEEERKAKTDLERYQNRIRT